MAPKQPQGNPLLKVGATAIVGIVILLCMAIANAAKNKTHRNTDARLELTRKRYPFSLSLPR